MPNKTVVVGFNGERRQVETGTTVTQFLQGYYGDLPRDILAALVNRRMVMLDFPLRGLHVELEAVRTSTREGEAVARRTASLLLLEATRELYPEVRLVVGQSLGGGYFYRWLADRAPSEQEVSSHPAPDGGDVRRGPAASPAGDDPGAGRGDVPRARAGSRSSSFSRPTGAPPCRWSSCGEVVDIVHGPVAPSAGRVRGFSLVPYEDGVLLRFPRNGDAAHLPPLLPQPRLFATYRETRRWNEVLGVAHVGSLNRLSLSGEISEVIRIAEGFHEKKVAEIADRIASCRDRVRLVLVAGPSSSGKTTFIRRLGIQLRVNGIRPVGLSLDNFFVDREQTPLGPDGKPDYEALEALDLPLFNSGLAALMHGEEVELPRYDFTLGRRVARDRWARHHLANDEVLLVEGIHGLNPRLTEAVPDGMKFRIFISALTQLTLDDHNRIFTSDSRLLRRIVRDRLFRGHPATRTLEMWGSVRRGEARGIFPFQEGADVMFNSALVYEPAVLKVFAERFLLEVPREHPAYTEAYRLLKFLAWFVPVFQDDVPSTSILREFIGGSPFES